MTASPLSEGDLLSRTDLERRVTAAEPAGMAGAYSNSEVKEQA
jgi:hypothetical protein